MDHLQSTTGERDQGSCANCFAWAGTGVMEIALDVQTGAVLWEWQNPGDVAPFSSGFNFRSLSVGPDGTLYYQDANEGPMGTLYAIGVIPEPGVMALFGFGLLALLGLRRKK